MDGLTQQPQCISVIVCDDVYRDELTKKLVVVGTFNTIVASQLPCAHPGFHALLTLTDGVGAFELGVAIEHAESGNKLVEMKGPAELTDPLQITDIDLSFHDVSFPVAGKYWLTVAVEGEIINQRPFIVQMRQDVSSV